MIYVIYIVIIVLTSVFCRQWLVFEKRLEGLIFARRITWCLEIERGIFIEKDSCHWRNGSDWF